MGAKHCIQHNVNTVNGASRATQRAGRLLLGEVYPPLNPTCISIRQGSPLLLNVHTLVWQEPTRIIQHRLMCMQADEKKATLSILQSTGMPYDTLSSLVSKLVVKSHLWIFSETKPELSKNKILLNFAKLYLEPATALMWYMWQ